MRIKELVAAAAVATVVLAMPAAAEVIDPVISSNDPLPFPQDAENEPALVLDRNPMRRTPYLVAGANDYRDQKVCSITGCEFTSGVGISGVYWSGDGKTWIDGSYTGVAAASGPTLAGKPIRTLPHFTRARWTRGDPGLAAGPLISGATPPAWKDGTLLYYSTLVASAKAPLRSVWVSTARRLPASPAAKPSWSRPTRASGASKGWLDKPAIWVDNAASSPSFGNAYVCWTVFASKAAEEQGQLPSGPIGFARSTNGGRSWTLVTVPKGAGAGRHGCAIRTDSAGRVYVLWTELRLTARGRAWLTNPRSAAECGALYAASIVMTQFDGTAFTRPEPVADVEEPGYTDRVQKRCTVDGAAGARTNSFPAVDIANGAPLGFSQPHEDTIVVAWSAGPAGRIFLRARINGAWLTPQNVTSSSDKAAAFPGVALSPNGRNVYVVYNGFAQDWQGSVTNPRWVQGVVRAAKVAQLTAGGVVPWGEVRGVRGDARGASNRDVMAEFLGDYSAVVATNTRAYAAWTDASAALQCRDITRYREGLLSGETPKPIAVPGRSCRPQGELAFGNVTICGAVLTAGEAGSGRVTEVTECKPRR